MSLPKICRSARDDARGAFGIDGCDFQLLPRVHVVLLQLFEAETALDARRDVQRDLRRFGEERAAAAHRIVKRRAGRPAGQAQDACGEVFAQRRRALVEAPAALEERVAGGVEIERAIVQREEREDADVGLRGVDVRTCAGQFAQAVADRVLHAQGREFEAA